MRRQIGQDLGPQRRQVVVGHGDAVEPGAHHLEHVLGLQRLVDGADAHRCLALALEPRVEQLQALPVAARRPHPDFLPREIVESGESRARRTGDHDLLDSGHGRLREVDDLSPLRGDGDGADRDVGVAVGQAFEQIAAGDRHDHDLDRQRAGLVLLVEVLLEELERLVGLSMLRGGVDEVLRVVVGDDGADDPALAQLVEVFRQLLVEHRSQCGWGIERGPGPRRRSGLLLGRLPGMPSADGASAGCASASATAGTAAGTAAAGGAAGSPQAPQESSATIANTNAPRHHFPCARIVCHFFTILSRDASIFLMPFWGSAGTTPVATPRQTARFDSASQMSTTRVPTVYDVDGGGGRPPTGARPVVAAAPARAHLVAGGGHAHLLLALDAVGDVEIGIGALSVSLPPARIRFLSSASRCW